MRRAGIILLALTFPELPFRFPGSLHMFHFIRNNRVQEAPEGPLSRLVSVQEDSMGAPQGWPNA